MEHYKKVFYNEVDMVTQDFAIVSLAKMPRTVVTPVVRDVDTGYLNVAPYSAGVFSVDPFQVIFGVKSWDSKLTYSKAQEFVVAVPSKGFINHMWVMACSVPHGINEMELAGLSELKSHEITTPGIKEFPLNLECKVAKFIQLPQPLRAIIIADVVGINLDSNLMSLDRSEVVRQYPMHEANIENPDTGLYGPSVLSGELIGGSGTTTFAPAKERKAKKSFIGRADFFKSENQDIFMNAVFPRPSYIVLSGDRNGKAIALPVSGGLLMNNRPTIQVPVRKDSPSYRNIKESGEFVVSIPLRSQIKAFEKLEETGDYETAGFSLIEGNQVKTNGLKECPINVDCKVVMIEDVPGNDLVLVLGRKVGLSVDEEILQVKNYMKLYSQYLYAVIDRGMVRKWGFHDEKNLSVRPLPSWGSRLHGGYWTGPEQYQAGMHFWLIELLESNYINESDYFKIRRWISWWRNEGWMPPEPLRSELRERLTTVLKMMLWAHRDMGKWKEVHEFFEKYPYEGKWQST